jgi:hypothetical protein
MGLLFKTEHFENWILFPPQVQPIQLKKNKFPRIPLRNTFFFVAALHVLVIVPSSRLAATCVYIFLILPVELEAFMSIAASTS